MQNTILIFTRLISIFIAFNMILNLPDDIWTLSLSSHHKSVSSYIFAKYLYHTMLSVLIWFCAPYIAKKIKFTPYNSALPNKSMLRIGLLLICVNFLLDHLLILINFIISAVSLFSKKDVNYSNVTSDSILSFMTYNITTITSLVSIILIFIFFKHIDKLENILMKQLEKQND